MGFFSKAKRSFLKTIEKRIEKRSFNDRFQKRLTTLLEVHLNGSNQKAYFFLLPRMVNLSLSLSIPRFVFKYSTFRDLEV